MGPQCRKLNVTLRIGSLEDGPASLDHEGTWLLGHTERVDFGEPWDDGEDLYVDAVIHVPCRYLRNSEGESRCGMYGYTGGPGRTARRPAQARRNQGESFTVIEKGRSRTLDLRYPRRSLPVFSGPNPCATAPCRTSDNRRRAACCRDLEIEIMCEERQTRLESLVWARKSPYICKVERGGKFSLDVELISACDYLGEDGVACTLHGRLRPDGRPAKPDLCSEWPHEGKGLHPGCVFTGGTAERLNGGTKPQQ